MIFSAQFDNNNNIRPKGNRRTVGCMQILKMVGSGTFGMVYKAVDKYSGDEVALKKIRMEREKEGFPVSAIREIKMLYSLNHKNVVNLREVLTYEASEVDRAEESVSKQSFDVGDVFMVFDFSDYDLSGLLQSYTGLSERNDLIKCYMHQLLLGIQYLHSQNVIHRDIKSANILISRHHELKIADMGMAKLLPDAKNVKLSQPVVTLYYRSPELVLGTRHYGVEVDMWSVG
jgi:cyclin-dependent kinase 12/13